MAPLWFLVFLPVDVLTLAVSFLPLWGHGCWNALAVNFSVAGGFLTVGGGLRISSSGWVVSSLSSKCSNRPSSAACNYLLNQSSPRLCSAFSNTCLMRDFMLQVSSMRFLFIFGKSLVIIPVRFPHAICSLTTVLGKIYKYTKHRQHFSYVTIGNFSWLPLWLNCHISKTGYWGGGILDRSTFDWMYTLGVIY